MKLNEIKTLQDLVVFWNTFGGVDIFDLESIIQKNHWVSDTGSVWGICHDGNNKVVIDDFFNAVLI